LLLKINKISQLISESLRLCLKIKIEHNRRNKCRDITGHKLNLLNNPRINPTIITWARNNIKYKRIFSDLVLDGKKFLTKIIEFNNTIVFAKHKVTTFA